MTSHPVLRAVMERGSVQRYGRSSRRRVPLVRAPALQETCHVPLAERIRLADLRWFRCPAVVREQLSPAAQERGLHVNADIEPET